MASRLRGGVANLLRELPRGRQDEGVGALVALGVADDLGQARDPDQERNHKGRCLAAARLRNANDVTIL